MGLEMCSTNKHVGVITTPLVSTPRKAQEMNFLSPFQFPMYPAQSIPELSDLGGTGLEDARFVHQKESSWGFPPLFLYCDPCLCPESEGAEPKAPTAQP